jgi:hypothetical protein
MPGKDLTHSRPIPGAGLFQKAGGIAGAAIHEGSHKVLTPAKAVYWTGCERIFSRLCETGLAGTMSEGVSGAVLPAELVHATGARTDSEHHTLASG